MLFLQSFPKINFKFMAQTLFRWSFSQKVTWNEDMKSLGISLRHVIIEFWCNPTLDIQQITALGI